MGAALTIFVLLSVSIFVIRIAAVALRLTGLSEASARFQALSAFSGTGFTTSEAETIVNYPIRRRIVSFLMVLGNIGLVSVFTTVVVSMINTEGEPIAVTLQLAWIGAGLIAIWYLILNPRADRILCDLISWILRATTFFGERHFECLVQVDYGHSVCEHPIYEIWQNAEDTLDMADFADLGLQVLAVREPGGGLSSESFTSTAELSPAYRIIVYGKGSGHDELERSAR